MNEHPIVYETSQSVGVIKINYPPVNALSQIVRQGLINGIEKFESNKEIKAIIIQCEGKTFIAGADIKEFGKPPLEPHLPEVVNRIENCNKPIIASLFGTTLGGGLEVALACHYRVAMESTKIGLPEVNLGLIPGAGGTQRLPRLLGTKKALEMISGGKHYLVSDLKESCLFDQIFDRSKISNLNDATLDFIKTLIETNQLTTKKTGEKIVVDDVLDWKQTINNIVKKYRGKEAPLVAANVIKEGCCFPIKKGMLIERQAFIKLRESEQSSALRYAFSAEKMANKTSFNSSPLDIRTVAIIGGGTMGSGIATSFLSSDFKVILIEQDQQALEAGKQRVESHFSNNIKRGRMSEEQVNRYLSNLTTAIDYLELSNCDLVVEAVFENMEVKKEIFAKLDKVCKKDCILATNTSYLNIEEIASVVSRPQQVIGMHFFSPANIMKLLEVVNAKRSSQQALMTAIAIAKKLKKISVMVKVCFGFAGNRMYTRYGREIQQMLLEGAKVAQVDNALIHWGMAMGPLAVADMSGIDIGHHARCSQGFPEYDPGYFQAATLMFEKDRYGKKTGAGFYRYNEEGKAIVDPNVDDFIQQKAIELNIAQRHFTDEDIVKRALYALISEGLQLLKDGIVQRSSDVDVIWLNGYGFPRHKGGPMFQAMQIGADKLNTEFVKLRSIENDKIWPIVDTSLIF